MASPALKSWAMVWAGIRNGVFIPNDTGWKCPYCVYRETCNQWFLQEEVACPQIVKACGNLISHNLRKIDKELFTENPDGAEVIVLECRTEEEEAVRVGREVQELVTGKGYRYEDMAVLYRCNFQSRIMEERFSQERIPYALRTA